RERTHELPERHQYASGLGRIAIPDKAVAGRTRWLLVPADFLRQRLRQPTRLFRVARGRDWTTDRLYLSDQQRMAGIHQPQGLRGICRTEQARRLERLAHVRDFAGRARPGASVNNPHDYEVGFHDVRFGSKADMCSANALWANSRHLQVAVT